MAFFNSGHSSMWNLSYFQWLCIAFLLLFLLIFIILIFILRGITRRVRDPEWYIQWAREVNRNRRR
ncbi:putative small transmembrane protein [Gambie virus]|uniref:Small transmembrane protein n=1 Tax=Gambie virus TaxID=1903427 RepID=A0ABM6DXS3_9MONO|nr:putative small transmembrane protein [Gambie virus]AOR51382.1 putative small transmembrane protein [Gambie virus]